MITKPATNEYPPRLEMYIGLTKEDGLIQLMRQDRKQTYNFFKNISPDMANYRYAEGKWTIKQVLMHINYVERIMQYRALAASRGDNQTPFGFTNHEAYIKNAEVERHDIDELLEEFNVIRNYSIEFFSGLTEKQLQLCLGSGEDAVSARAVGYALIGHARHHMNIINERYLNTKAEYNAIY